MSTCSVGAHCGTAPDVWGGHRDIPQCWEEAEAIYHGGPATRLGKTRAALSYYDCYPQEIEEQISENEAWNQNILRNSYPLTAR
jgi:hypothetical protein